MIDDSCCVNCCHFGFWPGDAGYSEYTPGSDMEIWCSRGKWRVQFGITPESQFRDFMRSSRECPQFKAVAR